MAEERQSTDTERDELPEPTEAEQLAEAPEPPEEEEAPPLDPEAEARRVAAMSFIRRLGDPILKSSATPIDRFDDSLRKQVSRMAGIMGDAFGVGLAAPAARALAATARLPRGARRPPGGPRQPGARVGERRPGDPRRGLPVHPGHHRGRGAPGVRTRARPRRGGGDPHGRGLRPRGPRDPARAGPPERRPHPGPHHARRAQASAARAARRGAGARSASRRLRSLSAPGGAALRMPAG